MFSISIVQISMYWIYNQMRFTILREINIAQCTILQYIIVQQINTSQMLVFDESGRLEYPGKNLSELSRETTNSIHTWCWVQKLNRTILVEGKCSHHKGNPSFKELNIACFLPCSIKTRTMTFKWWREGTLLMSKGLHSLCQFHHHHLVKG